MNWAALGMQRRRGRKWPTDKSRQVRFADPQKWTLGIPWTTSQKLSQKDGAWNSRKEVGWDPSAPRRPLLQSQSELCKLQIWQCPCPT